MPFVETAGSSRRRASLRLAFLCLATILPVEAGLRFVFLHTGYLDRAYVNCDAWWRLRWIRGKVHSEANIVHYYSIYRFDGLLGWTVKPGLSAHPMAKGARASTNSRGIRGTREYDFQKSSDHLRIVTVGDSFTFGEEVSDDETFPYYLGTLMPAAEVINMGVGGYGHDQMSLYLEREGLKYSPDVIVLGFLAEDAARNLLGFRDYWKPRFSLRGEGLRLETRSIPTVDETLGREFLRIKTFDLFEMMATRYRYQTGDNQKREQQITENLLDRIIDLGVAAHVRMLFAYLAVRDEIKGDGPSGGESFFEGYCDSRMKRYGTKFSCVDTRPEFRRRARAGDTFRGGQTEGHYDRAGHLLVAREIVAHLEGNSVGDAQDRSGN
jgi:hypothetical protein